MFVDEADTEFYGGTHFHAPDSFCAAGTAGTVLQTIYCAVDLGIVGQFGGDLSDVYVSAVSTGSQIMQTVTVVITGLTMGLTEPVGTIFGFCLSICN